jgi:hypothetical protein
MILWVWLVFFTLSVYYMAFVNPGETGEPRWYIVTLAIVASIIAATVATGIFTMILGFLRPRR